MTTTALPNLPKVSPSRGSAAMCPAESLDVWSADSHECTSCSPNTWKQTDTSHVRTRTRHGQHSGQRKLSLQLIREKISLLFYFIFIFAGHTLVYRHQKNTYKKCLPLNEWSAPKIVSLGITQFSHGGRYMTEIIENVQTTDLLILLTNLVALLLLDQSTSSVKWWVLQVNLTKIINMPEKLQFQ